MKKIINNFTLLLLVISFALVNSGCSKDPAKAKTEVELMTSASWKFSKATANGIDISSLIEACFKDNTITLTLTSTAPYPGSLDEGSLKCTPTDPQTISFTWQYDESFKKLIFNNGVTILPGGANEFSLESITETEMIISQNVSFSGTSQLVKVTLIH